jgi:mannose-6-phosphate isomerase-like protein (cupin superfamily)
MTEPVTRPAFSVGLNDIAPPRESTGAIRRVVTGICADGSSCVVSDGTPSRSHEHVATPGMVNTVVWATPASPQPRHLDLTSDLVSVVPGNGESVALVVTFPPDSVFADPLFDPAKAAQEQLEATPGLAELFEQDNPGFHRTPTIDYGVVLSGEIVLELDSTRTVLRPGDIVVQNGTRHAWRNMTDEPTTIFFVLIGTKPA